MPSTYPRPGPIDARAAPTALHGPVDVEGHSLDALWRLATRSEHATELCSLRIEHARHRARQVGAVEGQIAQRGRNKADAVADEGGGGRVVEASGTPLIVAERSSARRRAARPALRATDDEATRLAPMADVFDARREPERRIELPRRVEAHVLFPTAGHLPRAVLLREGSGWNLGY